MAEKDGIARLWVKIDLGRRGQIGPGKVTLLEAIRAHGSIAAAARAMQMSYRRAWLLVDELNRICGQPVVRTRTGGQGRGGAELTELGACVIERYRRISREANTVAAAELRRLLRSLRRASPRRRSARPARS